MTSTIWDRCRDAYIHKDNNDFIDSVDGDGYIFVQLFTIPGRVISAFHKTPYNCVGVVIVNNKDKLVYGINVNNEDLCSYNTTMPLEKLIQQSVVRRVFFKKSNSSDKESFRKTFINSIKTNVPSMISMSKSTVLEAIGSEEVKSITNIFLSLLSLEEYKKEDVFVQDIISWNEIKFDSNNGLLSLLTILHNYNVVPEPESNVSLHYKVFCSNTFTEESIIVTEGATLSCDEYCKDSIQKVYNLLIDIVHKDQEVSNKLVSGMLTGFIGSEE